MAIKTEAVWEEFREALKGFILKRVRSPEDAEDILQDVFTRIHDNIGSLRDGSSLRAWIYRIARNSVTDYYRTRRETVEFNDTVRAVEGEPGEEADPELTGCVRLMLESLPDRYKEALALTELRGMPQREVSEDLGISLSGAKSRVQRARERLKQEFLKCCHIEFDHRGNILEYRPRGGGCDCKPGRRK